MTALVVTPYTPSVAPDHGHGVHLRGLLRAVAERTGLVVVHPAEGELDPTIARTAVATATFEAPRRGFDRARDLRALAAGRMLRTAALDLTSIALLVERLVAEHDVQTVWVEGVELGEVASGIAPPTRRVVVLHEAARFASGREPDGVADRFVQRLDRFAAQRQQRRVVRGVDAVVVFTERDAEAVRDPLGAPVTVIPLGSDPGPDSCDPEGVDGRILFVGNFAHRPNVDAAERLVTRIFPLLRARHADTELRLVGPNPPAQIRALAGPGITVTGRVDDVADELAPAAVVVAPIDTGGGTRVKVLEALGAGKAVVASPTAVDGLRDDVASAVLVAEDDEGFAGAVSRLLDDRQERRRLGLAARAWSDRAPSWDSVAEAHLGLHSRTVRR